MQTDLDATQVMRVTPPTPAVAPLVAPDADTHAYERTAAGVIIGLMLAILVSGTIWYTTHPVIVPGL